MPCGWMQEAWSLYYEVDKYYNKCLGQILTTDQLGSTNSE
jgi:hypothetical protein